jgi:hypothetical protein
MEVLVCLLCDCGSPRSDCPECRDRGRILHWLPYEALSMLERPYILVNRRHIVVNRRQAPTFANVPVASQVTERAACS